MGETEEFNTLAFEKKLMQLKDTQESIQSLSSWCLKQRSYHKKIVSSWLNVLKRVKVEQRLVLFYLANDVIQYSKRKNYEFVESWGLNLQKATPLVRDEKVRSKILRIFKIWEQRSVYDDEFLSDLTGLLSAGAVKKADDDPLDFQPQQLVNKIKQCTVLEADTDMRLKCIHDSHLQLSDADALCANLKDRSLKDDVEKELNEGIACVERYTQALQREIVAREALLALLTSANQYYSTQRGEVKVVAHAYKNFGARVRALKRKLDELIPTLPNAAPSPPERDEDVPSPGPDEDLDLPGGGDNNDDLAYNIDQSFNTTLGADGSLYNLGLSSFLTSDNPLAIFNESNDLDISSANKIEVINSRPNEKQDFNINDFLKTFAPNDNNPASDNNSVASATLSQKSQDTLPGLDLLTPESNGNPPPPTSFYDEPDQPYLPEIIPNEQWNNNSWSIPPRASPVRSAFADTPESPPPAPPSRAPPRALRTDTYTQDLPPADVDHRGILPPPPPPPILPILGTFSDEDCKSPRDIEDVDHRLLPSLPPPPPAPVVRHPSQHQDVDHRNLIPLTHQLPPPIRPGDPVKLDQDYRVPTMVPPPDIVESVDMDLSEDEEQQRMYPNQAGRRNSFNNNKVLVGGDHSKNHDSNHTNLIQINSTGPVIDLTKNDGPHSAPVIPMTNPFDKMLPVLQFDKLPPAPQFDKMPPVLPFDKLAPIQFMPNLNKPEDVCEENSPEGPYDDDLRSRSLENINHPMDRHSPTSYNDFANDDWPRPRIMGNAGNMGNRYPRNWSPRPGAIRPNLTPQFWPRNRPPNRWMGPPRPQRFW